VRPTNVLNLTLKEFASLWRDPAAIVLILFAFTFAVYTVSKDIKTEVNNAPIGVVDNDHSPLSRRLTDALRPRSRSASKSGGISSTKITWPVSRAASAVRAVRGTGVRNSGGRRASVSRRDRGE